MELITREQECRPPNEAILRGVTETSFLNGKAITTRTDPIRDLEHKRLLLNHALDEVNRLIVKNEQRTVQDVEDEYLAIRRQDKRDLRLLNLSNAEKRAAEAGRRLTSNDYYANLCDTRDRLTTELAKLRIEIDFQRREFYRVLADAEVPHV